MSEHHKKYRMPPEWEPQSAIWVSWPHNVETWPENLPAAQSEFVAFAKLIAEHQLVKILCDDANHAGATQAFANLPSETARNIEFVSVATNDAWARDYAPTFVNEVSTGRLVAVDWNYNAWGGKYPPFDDDQKVASSLANLLNIDRVVADLCLEGGALEIDEAGVLLCTRSCALDPNRNPDKSLDQIESELGKMLGATRIIWLSGDSIEGDDTDGHIDQLARFTNEVSHDFLNEHATAVDAIGGGAAGGGAVVYSWTDDENDPQRSRLAKNLAELRSGLKLGSADKGDVRLIPLLMPPPIIHFGRRIPASYCNFLITNKVVVVPQFGNELYDRKAIETLVPLFPTRKVVGLSSLNLSVGLGSFHCLSQQQPVSN